MADRITDHSELEKETYARLERGDSKESVMLWLMGMVDQKQAEVERLQALVDTWKKHDSWACEQAPDPCGECGGCLRAAEAAGSEPRVREEGSTCTGGGGPCVYHEYAGDGVPHQVFVFTDNTVAVYDGDALPILCLQGRKEDVLDRVKRLAIEGAEWFGV